MSSKFHLNRVAVYFLSLYALLYMSNAIFGTFLPIYLDHVGYSSTAIGSLLALGPFVAIIAQPFWGIAGDRAKTKNNILKILVLGSAITAIFFRFSSNYYYLIAIMAMSTFFTSSVSPLSDAITLEYLDRTQWKFSNIRLAGTLGYALMSVLAGFYAKRDINGIFILYFFISILVLIVVFLLPEVKGHQSKGNKVSLAALLKNYELILLLGYATVIQATLGFFYAFFGLYFKEMGGDTAMLGWAMFISAIFEVPFLLFANRIINKIGIKYALVGSGLITAVRWILLRFITNPSWILPIQMLHGLSFIVISYSMVTYINQRVPKELKASGQAMFGLLGMGISRIIATLLGGYISDLVGIRQVFLYNAFLIIISTFIFLLLFHPIIKSKLKSIVSTI